MGSHVSELMKDLEGNIPPKVITAIVLQVRLGDNTGRPLVSIIFTTSLWGGMRTPSPKNMSKVNIPRGTNGTKTKN